MNFYDSPPPSPAFSAVKGCWDPVSVLGIRNPEHGHDLTCVGYAPSKGRRCWNPVNQYNRASAWTQLDKLAMMDPRTDDIEPLLHQIAQKTLCQRYHQNQADAVTSKWLMLATKSAARPQPRTTQRPRASQRPMATEQSPSQAKSGPSIKIEAASVDELIANLSQILDALKQEESARTRTRAEQESRRASEEAAEQRAREREREQADLEARKQREAEQRRKDEADRLAREAEQRRQDAARARVRAQEVREREERERREKLRKEFGDAWAAYNDAWEQFDELKKSSKATTEDLRWPVVSGSYLHVTLAAVKAFYSEALDGKTPVEKLKLMKSEALRWHPDRQTMLKLEGELLETVNMISGVVNDFRTQASNEREKARTKAQADSRKSRL